MPRDPVARMIGGTKRKTEEEDDLPAKGEHKWVHSGGISGVGGSTEFWVCERCGSQEGPGFYGRCRRRRRHG